MAPKQRRARTAPAYPLTIIQAILQVAPYGRTSSDVQREDETIKTQIVKLEGTIRVREDPELPLHDQLHMCGAYYDDGVSGTIPLEDRPEGRKLVAQICSHGSIKCDGRCGGTSLINQVWITKLDRLARKLTILLEIEAFLRQHNVALICMDPSIDTSTATGRLVFGVLAIIAEWERETILERTTGGKHQKASEGKWVGGRKTFGLKTDENGYLVVDDTLVERCGEMAYRVVQSIFENVALHGSTAWSEAQRTGLSDRRIGLILHNPRYKGEGGIFAADGSWTAARTNPPPQLVSPELWDRAQERLLVNRKNSSRHRHYPYLLTGLLTCKEPFGDGVCGRTFAGRIEKRHNYNKAYGYYYCSRQGCTARMLRVEQAEQAVWDVVKDAVRDPADFLARADTDRGDLLSDLRRELTHVMGKIQKADTERQNVLRSAEAQMRSWPEAQARIREIMTGVEELETERTTLELQIRSLNMDALDVQRSAIVLGDIARDLDEIDADDDVKAKETLIHGVVKNIEVRRGDDRPRLRITLSVGTTAVVLSGDLRSGQETSDNQQLQSQDPAKLARVGATYAEDNAQTEQEEFVIVREISLPPSRRGSAA
jgi:site-specific DNA recombinase